MGGFQDDIYAGGLTSQQSNLTRRTIQVSRRDVYKVTDLLENGIKILL